MADKNLDRKQQAQFLYMAQGKTQKEIAELVGVSERTVYAWIHQYGQCTRKDEEVPQQGAEYADARNLP
jgi:transposase